MAQVDDLRAAGFSDDEISQWSSEHRQTLTDAGFQEKEIDDYIGGAPEKTDPPPQALIDRFMTGTEVGRELSAVGKGVVTGWGDDSLGLSDESVKRLQEGRIFGDPRTGKPGILWPIEGDIKVLAKGIDAVGRAFNAGMSGVGAFVGQEVREEGRTETEARKAEMDVTQMANIAALLMGSVNPIRRPKVDSQGRVTMQTIGNLPKGSDFDAAAMALAGDAKGVDLPRPKLESLYQEKGLVPAEVLDDASRDVTITQDLLSDNVQVPRAYGGDVVLGEIAPDAKLAVEMETNPALRRGYNGLSAEDQTRVNEIEKLREGVVGEDAAKLIDEQETLFTKGQQNFQQMATRAGNSPASPASPATATTGGAGAVTPPGPPATPAAPPPGSPVDTVLSKISIGEKTKKAYTLDQFYRDTVDDLFPIARAVKESGLDLKAAEDPYKLARLTRGAPGKADAMLNHNTFDWNTYQENGKSLQDIISPVDPETGIRATPDLNQLRAYIASKRAVELADRGIEPGIDINAAREVIRNGDNEFGGVHRELVDYQDRLTQYLRDSGILSDEAYTAMREANKDYVPFFRVMDDEYVPGSGLRGAVKNPIKRITGSERDIVDPLESIIKNTYLYTNLAERNAVGKSFIEMADKSGRPGDFYERIAKPTRATEISDVEMTKFLQSQGITQVPPDLLTVFRAYSEPLAKDEIAVFTNGKREVYRVDPDIADSFKQLDRQSADFLVRVLAAPARLLRAGATLTPDFITRNVVRDFFTAFVNSKGIFSPIDTVKGLTSVVRKDADWEQWVRGGGANATMVAMDRQYLQQHLAGLTGEQSVAGRAWHVVKTPLEALRVSSELIENATRLGEFKKVMELQREAGITGKEATQEAAYAAREVTLDFARMGAKTRAYNMITAFANAQIQGLDRTVRAVKDNPIKTSATIIGGITLPSVLLWYANHDDERYKEIPQWEKDLFWIVMTDDHIYRVPKPFEVGIIFGSAVERSLDAFVEQNPDAYKNLSSSLESAFAPSVVPTFGVPVIEQFSNRSLFTGRNLVPAGSERLLPEYQYTPYTTELAKKLGEIFGAFPGIKDARTDQDLSLGNGVAKALSNPTLIENYVRAWTGGLGGYVLQITDAGLRANGILPDPPRPLKTLEELPVIKAFMIRYPSASAQSLQDFYDEYSRNEMYFNSYMAKAKEGDTDAMERIQKLGGDQIFAEMTAIKDTIGEHAKLVRDITKDPEMTPEDKRQLIDTLYYNMISLGQTGKLALRVIRETLESK